MGAEKFFDIKCRASGLARMRPWSSPRSGRSRCTAASAGSSPASRSTRRCSRRTSRACGAVPPTWPSRSRTCASSASRRSSRSTAFPTDTPAEVAAIREVALAAGARDAVVATPLRRRRGGRGGARRGRLGGLRERRGREFELLYPDEMAAGRQDRHDRDPDLRRRRRRLPAGREQVAQAVRGPGLRPPADLHGQDPVLAQPRCGAQGPPDRLPRPDPRGAPVGRRRASSRRSAARCGRCPGCRLDRAARRSTSTPTGTSSACSDAGCPTARRVRACAEGEPTEFREQDGYTIVRARAAGCDSSSRNQCGRAGALYSEHYYLSPAPRQRGTRGTQREARELATNLPRPRCETLPADAGQVAATWGGHRLLRRTGAVRRVGTQIGAGAESNGRPSSPGVSWDERRHRHPGVDPFPIRRSTPSRSGRSSSTSPTRGHAAGDPARPAAGRPARPLDARLGQLRLTRLRPAMAGLAQGTRAPLLLRSIEPGSAPGAGGLRSPATSIREPDRVGGLRLEQASAAGAAALPARPELGCPRSIRVNPGYDLLVIATRTEGLGAPGAGSRSRGQTASARREREADGDRQADRDAQTPRPRPS